MLEPLFIGDELSATGYRLAGMRVRTPQPEQLQSVLDWASSHSPLVVITAEYMSLLSDIDQQKYLTQETPMLVVVPDIRDITPVKDVAIQLRKQLGLLE